jgi:hypothetical protein
MKTALERRLAARQQIVEVGGKQVTLRRPTEYEKVLHGNLPLLEYVCQFVDACELSEADLFDGGSAEVLVPFEREVFQDWILDKPDMWKPLAEALGEMVKRYQEANADALKN